jgi:hypothetical protein
MEMTQPALQEAKITGAMVDSLRSTKTWTMLLAILGFISIAFMLLGSLGIMFGGALIAGKAGFPTTAMGIMYLILAFVYFIPALFLFRYSSSISRFLSTGLEADLESAMSSQKSFWKFVGILSLIGVVLSILAVVAAILIPLLMKGRVY